MSDERSHKGQTAASLAGVIWFIGWLFTIGYTSLVWWKIILGVVVWPYYLGAFLR
jgi:hypothetical protein